MSSGATYSPGAWFALVTPSAAVLVDPELPSDRLDELWHAVQSGEGAARALSVIAEGNPRVMPAFALAAVESKGVRLVVRGRIAVTVQSRTGEVRQISVPAGRSPYEEWLSTTDTVWFVRPGARPDGVALPIVAAAVLADVLAWQPMPGMDGWAVVASGQRSRTVEAPPIVAAPARADTPQTEPDVEEPPAALADTVASRRRSPQEIRAATGRTSAGLGSHLRRRYGAWDWSLPDRAAASVPQARNGTDEPDVEPNVEPYVEPDDVAPAPSPELPAQPASSEVLSQAELSQAELSQAEPSDQPPAEPAAPERVEPEPGAEQPVTYGMLRFSDGKQVRIAGPVIIGRAPSQAGNGRDRPAQLVTVPGAGRGLSRNHVRIDVGVGGLFVIDLGSRNGSSLEATGSAPVRMDAWVPYPLRPGMTLSFADSSCVFGEEEGPAPQ